MTHLQSHGPQHITAVLPASLLTHLTSLPLSTYNRRFPHNRLDNDVFTFLFQCKLRLAVVPPATQAHPCHYCHKPLNPYGDHLFQCHYNKKILSYNIRDTIYTICHTITPLAGFVHSPHSISCKTGNLLPNYPGKHPADVGLHLRPSALASTPRTPIAFFMAINITVSSTLSYPQMSLHLQQTL
jgi:hypothetical protein